MTYKMYFISKDNKYTIAPMGANSNVDKKKIDGVIKYSGGWIAGSKQALIDHANYLTNKRIEELQKEIQRLQQRLQQRVVTQ